MKNCKNNMQESYGWTRPKAVSNSIRKSLLGKGRVVIPRILLVIFFIEYILYAYLKIVLPDEIIPKDKLRGAFIFCFLFGAGVCFLQYFVIPFLLRWMQGNYSVNNKYITTSCIEQGKRMLSWKYVEGYWIEESTLFSDLTSIAIQAKGRHPLKIWLPEDKNKHFEILKFFERNSTQIESCHQAYTLEEMLSLTNRQLLFCWSFTLIFTVIAAIVFEMYFAFQRHFFTFLWILLLCPGTIAIAIVLGKNFYKDKQFPYAFILNMVALHLFIAIFVLAELYKYHKIIEGN